jgi:hypothetical protein
VNPQDLVALSVSTSSIPTATINALDFTTFTTDHQQPWRSSTPSTSTAPQNYNPQQHSFDQDFLLFATPETDPPVSTQASRAQATLCTDPNSQRTLQSRHLSINQRVSPVQSSLSPSLAQFNHRSFSSPALQQPKLTHQNLRQLAHLQRLPPVPLFDSSTTSVPQRRNHSIPNVPQGHHNMSTAFDSLFLSGGDMLASQDDFFNFGTSFQPTSFTAVNSGLAAKDGTISPTELFKDDSMIMSAPPSSAFPNLSTPDSGYLESPMLSSGLNTSPLEDGLLDGQLNFSELDSMTPLFPQTSYDQFAQQLMTAPTTKEQIPTKTNFSAVSSPATSMGRQKSSPGRPPSVPFIHGRKHSDAHGISKTPKSRKPLVEITVESEDDKETAKRKKNTAAARKSRQRKQQHMEAAQAEIQRLRAMVYSLGGDPDDEEEFES